MKSSKNLNSSYKLKTKINLRKKLIKVTEICLFFIFLIFSSTLYLPAQTKKPEEKAAKAVVAVVGGTLIDGTGKEPLVNALIIIEGDKIKAVGSAGKIKVPEGAQKIEAAGKWILPGFIDCHIHLTTETSDLEYYRDSNSLATLRAAIDEHVPAMRSNGGERRWFSCGSHAGSRSGTEKRLH